MIVFGERHLRWMLKRYFRYYLKSRTHLSLNKDAPNRRASQSANAGHVVSTSEVGVACTIVQEFVSKSDLVRAFTGLFLSASVPRARDGLE